MAVDCAKELRNHNVACVSLWPGVVLTENVKEMLDKHDDRIDPDTLDYTGIKVECIYQCWISFCRDGFVPL